MDIKFTNWPCHSSGLLISEAWFQCQSKPLRICSGQSDAEADFFPECLGFIAPCIITLMLHTHHPLMVNETHSRLTTTAYKS